MSAHAPCTPLTLLEPEILRHYAGGAWPAGLPTELTWSEHFGADDYAAALARAGASGAPLSLHVQLPFCGQACHFCASPSLTTQSRRLAEPYLSRLDREMVLILRHLGRPRPVARLHWGGGSTTYLDLDQMGDLVDRLDARFGLSTAHDRDFSIELDPRQADVFTLRHLQALGFNRLSLGVQDLDPRVQRAVNRHQPRALTEALIDEAERLGFRSLNIDLIVGLPLQTPESFADTLAQVIAMWPSRLTLYRYHHDPARFPAQQAIATASLPSAVTLATIQATAHRRLSEAGYRLLGKGQYVHPGDNLAEAAERGELYWSLTGFQDGNTGTQLGLGVAALSEASGALAQNALQLRDYERALDAGHLATRQGLLL